MDARRILFLVAVLFAGSLSAQTARQRLAIGSGAAVLHNRVNTSCELIEPVSLQEYSEYDAISIASEGDEIYSPELSNDDYLVIAKGANKELVRSARKSGFRVRMQAAVDTGTVGTQGSSCPDLFAAQDQAEHARTQRRIELQTQLHRIHPGMTIPQPSSNVQLKLSIDAAFSKLPHGMKPLKEGTVIVAFVVDAAGAVRNVAVTQKLDPMLDQLAVQAARQWRFLPARMDGLPVPVALSAAVKFTPTHK